MALIGAESMTDLEYAAVDTTGLSVNTYNQASYDQLAAVLISRESVSTFHDKLVAFYVVKGLNVTPAKTGKSNIYVGDVLE